MQPIKRKEARKNVPDRTQSGYDVLSNAYLPGMEYDRNVRHVFLTPPDETMLLIGVHPDVICPGASRKQIPVFLYPNNG